MVRFTSFRYNVLFWYSLITFTVTLALSTVLGLSITTSLTNYEIESHVQTFPQIIDLAFPDTPEVKAWFEGPPSVPPPSIAEHLNQLLHLGKIFRIKVWTPGSRIQWSNDATIIGNQVDNPEVFEAIEDGQPLFEIGELEKLENASEAGRGATLQVYTPIRQGSAIVGVVELYEENSQLWSSIAANTQFIWLQIAVFGVVLYLALFFLFFRAWNNQRNTNHQLDQTQDVTIFALAYQAELRDHETGEHLERTSRYVGLLARGLGLDRRTTRELVKAAPLHDIGKVGIPDQILRKPGPLTAEEREIMKTHCALGDQVLAAAESKLPFRSFLTTARELTLSHHEKWDGTGYPQGLAGDAIPLPGRIMAVADVYDALRSARPYKLAWSHQQCVDEIRRLSGTHFDPRLVEVFLAHESEFARG